MKKFLFLLFIVIAGFTLNDVQSELIVLDWNKSIFIENSNVKIADLIFENPELAKTDLDLPVFFRTFDVKTDNQNLRFEIENPVFEESAISSKLSEFDNLTSDVQIINQKLKSGTLNKIHLQIIPLKKENDKIFVLKSFELKSFPINTKSAKKEVYNWKTESVLKQGTWKKISTEQKGIYKIPYTKLNEWGFSNPSKVNVFGSGGIILSENPSEISYDDLPQISVWHGKNNGADCLFFYSPGITDWKLNETTGSFEHRLNYYTTKGYFFLSENIGTEKVAKKLDVLSDPANQIITSFSAYDFFEEETENLIKLGSGKQWYGNKFKNSSAKSIDFDVSNIDLSEDVSIRINSVARSFQSSVMKVSANQTEIGELSFSSVNTSDVTSLYARSRTGVFNTNVKGDPLNVTLKYFADKIDNSIDDNANAWLNFVEINYRKKLVATGKPQFFRDLNSVGNDNIGEFNIEGSTTDTRVFDVTDWKTISEIPIELSGSVAKVKRPTAELREYVVFNNNGNFSEPILEGEVQNQNLHSLITPEFIIITHLNFLSYANQLADFHRSYDGMDVEVVTAAQVYNEFSSGAKDATGIRNFVKMLYDRGEGKLKYVLLFGDGSFDNRGIRSETKNFIPTYQADESLNPVQSFVSDDYFVILDDGESVDKGLVDLGIGRIPASTTYEAEVVLTKILNYYSSESLGAWRNSTCFISDDEDGGLHMGQSEELANIVNSNHPEFITNKIYLDAYQQQVTSAVERYPEVTSAINNQVKEGVLILNYVGHANERFMADEHVLDVSNVNSWSNSNNLPIFVTATCEFSRYDADDTSIGEYILFNSNGGGIGLFSTTRVVISTYNFLLSKKFYQYVFEADENGNRYRMGDVMRLSKINTTGTTNKRNFSLLADPALKLSYPKFKVKTTRINGKDASANQDTISALQKIELEGNVTDYFGNILEEFTGGVSITVYDKEMTMKTLGNGGETPMSFKVQENIIYKGKADVKNGNFTCSFVIPKDISYALGQGKIIYYASDNSVDAHGVYNNFIIGGSSDNNVVDNTGPEIDLFMDHTDFVSGGKTGKNTTLLAFLSDENGINTVGTGIGHDITAVLDDDYANTYVLNNYYLSDLNDYKSGSISFTLTNLTEGKHKLVLKAWDVANNSTQSEIEFEVSGGFQISSVTNYPNPVNDHTYFTFEHNQSGEILDIAIEIFDQMGRRVDYLTQEVGSNGSKSNPIRWDFMETQVQMKSGIYPYRITAQNNEGAIASHSGKLIISH
ncbi:MAG: type IX secretion system sortase PorU [Draconibacterium sp.]